MNEPLESATLSFQAVTGPHLDAAYNLARWLTRNPQDADDVMQEAHLRAYRFFGTFRGGDGRAWLLTIVRNTFYSWYAQGRARSAVEVCQDVDALDPGEQADVVDERLHGSDPARLIERAADQALVTGALEALPAEYREILVLRELEGLSYREIADIAGLAMGTVMSRLSRARLALRRRIEQVVPR